MGRRGPAPTPTKLKLLHGETRPYRIGTGEPQPGAGEPEIPEWLSPEARLVWHRTVKELTIMGLAHRADTDSLVVYVNAVVNHARAQRLLDASGVLMKGTDGAIVRNPANAVVNHNASIINRFAREFGLTPSARVSLGDPKDLEDTRDAAARLLS